MTVILECACNYCEDFATKKGYNFPLRFEIAEKAAKVRGATAKGRHCLAKAAYQPPFGRYDQIQQKFGPWAVK